MSKKVVSALVKFEEESDGYITLYMASRHDHKSVEVRLPTIGTQDQIGQITGYEIGKQPTDIITLREALNWLYGLEEGREY